MCPSMASDGSSSHHGNCHHGHWVEVESPPVYDCHLPPLARRMTPEWMDSCQYSQQKFKEPPFGKSRRLAYLPCPALTEAAVIDEAGREPSVEERILRRLANATVVIPGDSASTNFWCALTCRLGSFSNATMLHQLKKDWPIQGTRSIGIQHTTGITWFMQPQCERSTTLLTDKQRHSMPKSNVLFRQCHGDKPSHCASWLLSQLQDAATSGRRVAVVYNPCGAQFRPCVFQELANGSTVFELVSLRQFAAWRQPLDELLALADGQCHKRDGRTSTLYRETWDAAMSDLRSLNTFNNSLGVAMESMIPHFEEVRSPFNALVRQYPSEHIGEPGSWHRAQIGIILWLHPLLATSVADKLLCRLHLSWNDSLTKASASMDLLAAARLHASACNGTQVDENTVISARCLEERLASLVPRLNASSASCPLASEPLRAYLPKSCSELPLHADHSFRVPIEADGLGVPVLRLRSYRTGRWDAHPIRDFGGSGAFDCLHSNFAPGAFDGELAALLSVLDRRAASAQSKPSPPATPVAPSW